MGICYLAGISHTRHIAKSDIAEDFAIFTSGERRFPALVAKIYFETCRNLPPPKFDIVEVVHIVEGTNANPAFAESLVTGGHDGLLHVVEEDFDRALLGVALYLDLMPLVGPRNLIFVFSECLSRCAIDDHDLTAVRIRTCAEMDVVEMGWVLMVEKDAAVAMVSGVLRTADAEGEDEVAQLDVLDQGDVVWAAHLGLVIVLAGIDSEDVVLLHLAMSPTFWICQIPTFESFFEVFAEDKREVGFGVFGGQRCEGKSRESQDERVCVFQEQKDSIVLLVYVLNRDRLALFVNKKLLSQISVAFNP